MHGVILLGNSTWSRGDLIIPLQLTLKKIFYAGIWGIRVSFIAVTHDEGILRPTDVRIDPKGFACCKAVVLNDDLYTGRCMSYTCG